MKTVIMSKAKEINRIDSLCELISYYLLWLNDPYIPPSVGGQNIVMANNKLISKKRKRRICKT